jgi:hypothetical protein
MLVIANQTFRSSGGRPDWKEGDLEKNQKEKAADEQHHFDQARAMTTGQVRCEPWGMPESRSGREALAAADAIIVESQLTELEIEVELVKLCLYVLNVQMFTIVFPYIPLAVWIFLVLRLRNDLRRLTFLCRRHVPMYPTSDDPLGGLQWWLTSQTWACVVIVGMFFIACTGCMEAWVELFSPERCSVAKPANTTQWKFPACSAGFDSEIPAYSELDDQAQQGWPIGTPVPQEVMSINRTSHSLAMLSCTVGAAQRLRLRLPSMARQAIRRYRWLGKYERCPPEQPAGSAVHVLAGTCWQEESPELPACPFHAGTSEFVDNNFISTGQ